jgi:hypothetical protein
MANVAVRVEDGTRESMGGFGPGFCAKLNAESMADPPFCAVNKYRPSAVILKSADTTAMNFQGMDRFSLLWILCII